MEMFCSETKQVEIDTRYVSRRQEQICYKGEVTGEAWECMDRITLTSFLKKGF